MTDPCRLTPFWSRYRLRVWTPSNKSDIVEYLPGWLLNPKHGSHGVTVFGMQMIAQYQHALRPVWFGVN